MRAGWRRVAVAVAVAAAVAAGRLWRLWLCCSKKRIVESFKSSRFDISEVRSERKSTIRSRALERATL